MRELPVSDKATGSDILQVVVDNKVSLTAFCVSFSVYVSREEKRREEKTKRKRTKRKKEEKKVYKKAVRK
jgi:hypothetical protein